jgi:hypothetical protein
MYSDSFVTYVPVRTRGLFLVLFWPRKKEPGYGMESHINIKQIKYCVYNYCTSKLNLLH